MDTFKSRTIVHSQIALNKYPRKHVDDEYRQQLEQAA